MINQAPDMETLFEVLYNKLISPDFGKNLGGELPLFIQPIPSEYQADAEGQAGILETILSEEQNLERDDIISTLDSVLDIKTVIIPRIKDAIIEANPQYAFISGVGSVYPFVRSHGILNNIDELTNECNLILFFPGEYNNLQLKLFGSISDENYYRGHNLNEIN